MKDKTQILSILKKHEPVLKERYNVRKIGIFGSYVRGHEKRESDVDILVDLHSPIGWEYVDLKEYLETILEMDVDLVTVKALKPQLKDVILKEVVYT